MNATGSSGSVLLLTVAQTQLKSGSDTSRHVGIIVPAITWDYPQIHLVCG